MRWRNRAESRFAPIIREFDRAEGKGRKMVAFPLFCSLSLVVSGFLYPFIYLFFPGKAVPIFRDVNRNAVAGSVLEFRKTKECIFPCLRCDGCEIAPTLVRIEEHVLPPRNSCAEVWRSFATPSLLEHPS